MNKQDELNKLKLKQDHAKATIGGMEQGCTKRALDIAILEAEIADAEVTYSIGDRFTFDGGKRLLVEVKNEVYMISLKYGSKSNTIGLVGDTAAITEKEFGRLITVYAPYIRYWDNRKQEKC